MKYFSVPEAAKVIHRSKDKLYEFIREGRITIFYDGTKKLIREDYLDKFMEENFMVPGKRVKKIVNIPDRKEED